MAKIVEQLDFHVGCEVSWHGYDATIIELDQEAGDAVIRLCEGTECYVDLDELIEQNSY